METSGWSSQWSNIHLLFTTLLLSSCIADLRPDPIIKNDISQQSSEKADAVISEMLKAHGVSSWNNISTVEYVANSSWHGILGTLGCPWPQTVVDIQYLTEPNTFNVKAEFLNTPLQGLVWGIQSWKSYSAEPGGEIVFEVDQDIKFGLSTAQYLAELPFRIAHAPIRAYVGENEKEGNTYDLIFATWEKPEPHPEHDQFILWIDKKTKLLKFAQYTIREGSKFATAWVIYEGYRQIGEVMMPLVFYNKSSFDSNHYFHRHVFKDIKFDSFDICALYPDERLPAVGDDKPI